MNKNTDNSQFTILTKISLLFLVLFIILLLFLGIKLTTTAQDNHKELLARHKKITIEQRISLSQEKELIKQDERNNQMKKLKEFSSATLKLISDKEFIKLTTDTACITCHKPKVRGVGPSFKAINSEYKGIVTKKLVKKLVKKVRIGSIAMQTQGYTGPWFSKGYPLAMPPNTTPVNDADLEKVIFYILSYNKVLRE